MPLNALFMMLMAMFITVPETAYKNGSIQFVQSLKADNIIGGGIQVSASGVTRIGTTGLFTAIVIGWATVQIYRFTIKHNWQIKMPDVVPAGVSNSFSSLIPGFCVAFVVATINLILVLMGTDIFKVIVCAILIRRQHCRYLVGHVAHRLLHPLPLVVRDPRCQHHELILHSNRFG